MSNEEIAKSVIKKLSKLNKNLSVAESITGGGLATALSDIAGSSKVFVGGVIAYSDEVKINHLSVSKSNIKKYGPVSEEVVLEMANSCLKKFKADNALAIVAWRITSRVPGRESATAKLSFLPATAIQTVPALFP